MNNVSSASARRSSIFNSVDVYPVLVCGVDGLRRSRMARYQQLAGEREPAPRSSSGSRGGGPPQLKRWNKVLQGAASSKGGKK